ncbi:unnamed protein product [Anisakis simplex]|uniref:Uncharacterized protein n=1 Tax=Anisakis simplex TaxID=6269 RepID=A0A0M3KJ73_ANISI|nr:unnamed protein product [Anisakis simplex]
MSRFIDVVLLLVIVTTAIHNANLQSLDYDYLDREFRRTIPFQGIVRMPMSDIGAQQRAQLSMIATNSEPFFDRRSQWSRYEPPQSTVNQKETMWWKSWPRQLPISTIPSSHVSGMGLPSQPVVPSMMVVPIEPVVTQPSILNSALMTVFGNASDNGGTTAQKPLTAFLNSFPGERYFLQCNFMGGMSRQAFKMLYLYV